MHRFFRSTYMYTCLLVCCHGVQRLQSHTLAKDPHSHSHKPDAHAPVDSDIARWIEERDILLQTGVYSSFDPTIQKLDQKIRDALAVKSSSTSH